jgi:hypothetical protein
MTTLKTQYKNYKLKNPNSSLLFEEWKDLFSVMLSNGIKNLNRETYLNNTFPNEDKKTYIQSLDEHNSKKKKLTEDELKEIFEKVYIDRTDYKNINTSIKHENLSDDYDIIGGIIYKKRDLEE